MTEKNFSVNFQMYNMDGLRLQFTVRSDDASEHMSLLQQQLDWLTREGYSVNEPDSNAKPKVVPIVAFVRSTAQDSKTNSYMPCVHLYSPWGNFKAATVYHERLGDLPFDWESAKLWDGAAPDRENAGKRGVLTTCEEFKVVLAPRTDFEGNVKRSDSGNIIYQYDRVLNQQEAPQAPQAPSAQQAANRTTTPTNAPQRSATSAEELNGINVQDEEEIPFGYDGENPFSGPVLIKPEQSKIMHAIGTAIYGKGWDEKRHMLVKRDYKVESSSDLTTQQAEKFIDYLAAVGRGGIEKNLAAFKQGELSTLIAEHNNGEPVFLGEASAMVIAAVVKVLQKRMQPA